jgi:hypothetical protein
MTAGLLRDGTPERSAYEGGLMVGCDVSTDMLQRSVMERTMFVSAKEWHSA